MKFQLSPGVVPLNKTAPALLLLDVDAAPIDAWQVKKTLPGTSICALEIQGPFQEPGGLQNQRY
jgi:hypothetical protein